MVNNPSFYSQTALADTSSITQITDGADFPHSGLVKALSDGLGQNYAISGFNITPTNATQGSVATGTIMRDGVLVTVGSVLNFTLTTTHTSGTNYGYHLVVVDSSNALALRTPTATNKVPHPTSGDTIIAVLTHTGTNPFNAQYLTVDKTSNGLTIGFNSSGFSEVGKITASDATQMLIQSTASNAHITLSPNGTGRVKIVSTDLNDAELLISKDVAGSIGEVGIDLEMANSTNDQTGRVSLESSVFIGMALASDSRDGIRFLTGDGSEAERLRIQSGGDVVITNGNAFRTPELQTDSKSASYTLDADDAGKYFFITGSSTVITLPASPSSGQHYTLLSNDGNGFTLRTGTGSSDGDTMNGAQTDISVSTYNGVSCISDGTNWVVLGA
jgi:hypothetical protein